MAFVSYPDPALGRRAAPRPVDGALRAIGEQLLAAAIESQANGLAAAHLGIDAPVIVLNVTPERNDPTYRLYFNPTVVTEGVERQFGGEASVSLPGVEVDIERAAWADIAFDDAEGQRHEERVEGFVARCALHEIEQMNGRFFLMNLSRLKRDMLLKKLRKRS